MLIYSYESPFKTRYSSAGMQKIFSASWRARLWRRLWSALAREQMELGFPVTSTQVEELENNVENIDFDAIAKAESETRHEVIAHIRAYGAVAPTAKPIIHLGATSAFVMDNSDLLQIRDALRLIEDQLVHLISELAQQARHYHDLPVLGFTHFQPAQLTTLGKRICLWIQDFSWDLAQVRRLISDMPFLGMKGATGTQASLLTLCNGDVEVVEKLDAAIARAMGFSRTLIISGQTYSRKLDSQVYAVLAGVAESASKMAHDIRLLQHLGEVFEPFRGSQVGSSAMPYKRNPMACERICGLARYLITLSLNGNLTAATQWLERSLDDSVNKRIATPEAFLAADAILHHAWNVAHGLDVSLTQIRADVERQLPFMATEEILMQAVKAGGDRQEMHERLRVLSLDAARRISEGAQHNDLMAKLADEPAFASVRELLIKPLDPRNFIGLAPRQVVRFIEEEIAPILPKPLPDFPWKTSIEV